MLIECKMFDDKLYVPLDKVTETIALAIEIERESANWPFPPCTGAIPWTAKQIQEYAEKGREKLGDALW